MRLGSILRFHDADEIEGAVSDRQRAAHDHQVREARLTVARRQSSWTALPETRLVRRGPFLIDAEHDGVYTVRRGHVFEPGGASIGYAARCDLERRAR